MTSVLGVEQGDLPSLAGIDGGTSHRPGARFGPRLAAEPRAAEG
jgi:hypothetical protein